MPILQKYLLSETGKTVLTVFLVLLGVALSTFLADALSQVAKGRITPDQVFWIMTLHALEAFKQLLPLAMFYGVLLAIGRLYRDQEMSVMRACGLSPWGLLAPLLLVLLPVFLVLLWVGLQLAPWADRLSDQLARDAARSLSLAGLQAGRFHPLPGGAGVAYVETLDEQSLVFERIFVYMNNREQKDLVTAAKGQQIQDEHSQQIDLILQDGFRVEGKPGSASYRILTFEENRIRLPAVESQGDEREIEAVPTQELIERGDDEAWAELRSRFHPAWSSVVLLLLALPLAHTGPRASRHARLAAGILIYILYGNLMSMARLWYERGATPEVMGMEWIHLVIAALAILWWMSQQSPVSWWYRKRINHETA